MRKSTLRCRVLFISTLHPALVGGCHYLIAAGDVILVAALVHHFVNTAQHCGITAPQLPEVNGGKTCLAVHLSFGKSPESDIGTYECTNVKDGSTYTLEIDKKDTYWPKGTCRLLAEAPDNVDENVMTSSDGKLWKMYEPYSGVVESDSLMDFHPGEAFTFTLPGELKDNMYLICVELYDSNLTLVDDSRLLVKIAEPPAE